MTKDIVTSIKAQLINVAKKENKNFNSILLLYMQERLLYRLSISEYRDKFILKGGLLLFSMTGFKGRPTRDIDFLALNIGNQLELIVAAFINICSMEFSDGISYDVGSITLERIKEDADYEGVRVKVISYLGKAKETLQLDIGFGDVVIPKPPLMDYPVLLGFKAPNIKVYSPESIIAEKFEAMISLSVLNSRINEEEVEFENIMREIKGFLQPIYDAIIKEDEVIIKWDSENKLWI